MKKLTDKERLDWLSKEPLSKWNSVYWSANANSGDFPENWPKVTRAAIDAAIRAQRKEESRGK